MTKVRLESLNIEVVAPREIYYSWDGEVDDIHDHCTALRQQYAKRGMYSTHQAKYKDIEEERKKFGDKVNGTISKFYKFRLNPPPRKVEISLHAYIRKGLAPTKSIFVRGHEEAHALYIMGMAHLLGREVDKVCGSGNFLERAFELANSMHDKPLIELIANYGGRQALLCAALNGSIQCTPEEIDELSREMWDFEGEPSKAEIFF